MQHSTPFQFWLAIRKHRKEVVENGHALYEIVGCLWQCPFRFHSWRNGKVNFASRCRTWIRAFHYRRRRRRQVSVFPPRSPNTPVLPSIDEDDDGMSLCCCPPLIAAQQRASQFFSAYHLPSFCPQLWTVCLSRGAHSHRLDELQNCARDLARQWMVDRWVGRRLLEMN